MFIPNKINTVNLTGSFQKQICAYINDLRQCIIDLKKENEILKSKLK
jgi:hypothetical protein